MGSKMGVDKPTVQQAIPIPASTRRRLEAAGIDLSGGYPLLPTELEYLQDAEANGDKVHQYKDAALRADPEKKELFGAAKAVNHLTSHIGTEIIGVHLKDLNDKQKDELALLVAERGVVFFRDQNLSPQEQEALGKYWGELFVRTFPLLRNKCLFDSILMIILQPQGPYVPGYPNITTIWSDYFAKTLRKPTYRQPFQGFHT